MNIPQTLNCVDSTVNFILLEKKRSFCEQTKEQSGVFRRATSSVTPHFCRVHYVPSTRLGAGKEPKSLPSSGPPQVQGPGKQAGRAAAVQRETAPLQTALPEWASPHLSAKTAKTCIGVATLTLGRVSTT